MAQYLIVSDVDGTLAYDSTTISARTSQVINQLLDAGHLFYLATGRMYALAAAMAEQIGPRAEIISANGAAYEFSGQKTHHLLGSKALAAIEAAAASNGLTAVYFTDTAVYYVTTPPPAIEQMLYSFAPKDVTIDVTQLPDIAALQTHSDEITNGIIFSLSDPEALANTREQLAAQSLLHLSASDPTNIELIPKHVDKANAILELQAKTGIPKDRTIAFGDGLNDLGMLKAAGISVAMGNAVPEVKAVAKYVTETNKEDGLAQFLLRFFDKEES